MAPAVPCKTSKNSQHGATRGKSNEIKSKLACILEASESTRLRMGESLPNHHEDHFAGKGDNPPQHFNLVHKFILMPQAMKIPAAKAAVDEEWEKLEKIPAWDLPKVRNKKEVIDEARMSGVKVHFASLVDICHLKTAELEAKHQKYKGRVVLRGDIVKDNSGSYAVFTEQGSSASQMTAAKVMDIISRLPGCDGQAADAVSAYTQVKMKDAPKLLKNPKSECPDIWNRLPRHKMAKIMSSMEDPVVPLERNLYGHPLAGLLWEKAIWENPIETWMGENSKLGMSLFSSWKRIILICVCGWHKIGWKKTKSWSDVESTQWRSWFGRTNIFPWSCVLGLHSKTMQHKQRYYGQLQNHVRIENFRRSNWKIPCSENLHISSWSYDMKVMWDDILSWQTKRLHNSTRYQLVHWWPSFQRRRIEIRGRIVTSILSICPKMHVLGTNWKTW